MILSQGETLAPRARETDGCREFSGDCEVMFCEAQNCCLVEHGFYGLLWVQKSPGFFFWVGAIGGRNQDVPTENCVGDETSQQMRDLMQYERVNTGSLEQQI